MKVLIKYVIIFFIGCGTKKSQYYKKIDDDLYVQYDENACKNRYLNYMDEEENETEIQTDSLRKQIIENMSNYTSFTYPDSFKSKEIEEVFQNLNLNDKEKENEPKENDKEEEEADNIDEDEEDDFKDESLNKGYDNSQFNENSNNFDSENDNSDAVGYNFQNNPYNKENKNKNKKRKKNKK